jgi:thymidylate kinase
MTNEQKKLEEIFEELNKDINYIYMRDFNFLKNIIKNKKIQDDIDLIINKKDKNKIINILHKHNYYSINKIHSSNRDLFFYNALSDDLICFNIHINNLVKMTYLEGKILLENKQKDSFLFVLKSNYKLVILVFKDLFLNGLFSVKKYSKSKQIEIEKLIKNKENRKFLINFSKNVIGKRETKVLLKYLDKKEYDKITNNRRNFQIRAIIKNPLFIRYIIKNVYGYLKSKVINPPLFITFLGVDGSGKTTTINNVKEFVESTGRKIKTVYMGRWGGFLIPIHKIFKSKKERKISLSMNEVEEKHMQKNFKFYFNLFIRDCFYILEYSLRYFFRILPFRIMRKNIICDRYVYDLLLMKNKTKLLELFVKLYPKPKQVFILYNDPKILFKRKKELNVKELERQQNILFKFKNKILIKTENQRDTYINVIKQLFK